MSTKKGHPPIVTGGHAPEVFRRAVLHCAGWYGFGIDAATTARCIEGLRTAEREHGRPAHLGPLEVSVTPAAKISPDTVREYADLGCHRLIFHRPSALEADALATVEHIGALVKG